MNIKFSIVSATLIFSAPANAQSYGGISQGYESFLPDARDFSEARDYSAPKVLARLRALCSSNKRSDQYYCARGMKVLKEAHAEYQLRLATRDAATR